MKKYLKKLVGRKDVEDALQRLDKLTQVEAQVAAAETLAIDRGIGAKVEDVDGRVQVVDERVQSVDTKVEGIDDKVQGVDSRVQGIDSNVHGVDYKIGFVIQGDRVDDSTSDRPSLMSLTGNELRRDLRMWMAFFFFLAGQLRMFPLPLYCARTSLSCTPRTNQGEEVKL
ncbi:hypothetical protein H4582DRAFT_1208169 [Lactarius indigo]|nr:hypothetical protein H4582DRAFT_1208169 [Lactarius indigo]